MVGVKAICALLLAGSMGAGSVVAVQQVKPAIAKKRSAVRPAVVRTAAPQSRPAPTVAISDCPIQVAALAQPMATPSLPDPQLAPGLFASQTAMFPAGPGALAVPGAVPGGDIGGGGVNPVPPPSIPEPASWAMIMSGFGLIGFALRRRPDAQPDV